MILNKAARMSSVKKHAPSPLHQQRMQLGRQRCQHLKKVNFENSLRPVAGLPIPSKYVRLRDRNRYGVLTQSLARLPQFTDRLFNIRKREILRSKRNYSPNTARSRIEELPIQDVPCAMCPRLLVYIRFCDERRKNLTHPPRLD